MIVQLTFAGKLRLAADAVQKSTEVAAWSLTSAGQSPRVAVSWDVGSAAPGYDHIRREVEQMVEMGLGAFIMEAKRRITSRAEDRLAEIREIIENAPG